MYPCSFIQKIEYGVDLNKVTIEEAWWSIKFNKFKTEGQNNFIGCCPCGLNSFSNSDIKKNIM
jgi:hypothetical protein